MDKSEILALRRAVLEKDFARMNDRQKQAVFTVNGPLLILAGAGSGKTTVLINRIANILRYGDAYNSTYLRDDLDENDIAACKAYIENGTPLTTESQEHLSVSACAPWRIMAITFTNKAAGELKDRLCAMLGETANDIWASTFHSTCARILRHDGTHRVFLALYGVRYRRPAPLDEKHLKRARYFGKKHHAKIDFERDFPGKGFFNLAC